jgi:hypothetical protein
VFVHVVAAFAFVLAHGVAVFAGFRVRHERDRARITALLDLSTASLRLDVRGAAGCGRGWTLCGRYGRVARTPVAVDVDRRPDSRSRSDGTPRHWPLPAPPAAGRRLHLAQPGPPLGAPPDPETADKELALRLRSRRPELLAAIGGSGLLIVIGPMVLKPF